MQPKTIDIFCTIIDNFGDIGVCWRLAKQLQQEYQLTVRLWVDDLASFAKLEPSLALNTLLILPKNRNLLLAKRSFSYHHSTLPCCH